MHWMKLRGQFAQRHFGVEHFGQGFFGFVAAQAKTR
jgi:hypothetical protein